MTAPARGPTVRRALRRSLLASLALAALSVLRGLRSLDLDLPAGIFWLAFLTGFYMLLVGPAVFGASLWLRDHPQETRPRRAAVVRGATAVLGVVSPLLLLALGIVAGPEWKGEAPLGWLSCVPATADVWLPFAVWAASALYATEVLGRALQAAWAGLGLLSGTILSAAMAATLLAHLRHPSMPGMQATVWLAAVPVALSTLYGRAAWRAFARLRPARSRLVATLAANLGIALLNVERASHRYAGLPEQRLDCYVVTAAARGHARLVGPLGWLERAGARINVNGQLIVLWETERQAARRWPRLHRGLRAAYDRLAPALARGIGTPLRADAAYLTLKPLEWLATCWLLAICPTRRAPHGKKVH